MNIIFAKLASLIAAPIILLGSLFNPIEPVIAPIHEVGTSEQVVINPTTELPVGAALPQATGVFETSLAAPITSTATSMTLTANAVRGGGAVAGYTCFTVDEGTAQAEVICGTVSSTAVTSLTRGVSYADGTTSVAANKFAHRRGANVKITDFPVIQILKAQNNGDETFPNPLTYDTGIGPVDNSDLTDKEYVLSVVNGGTVTFDKRIEAGTAGETVAAGNLVYLKASDGRWWKTDADDASTVENVTLGFAQGAGTAGNAISGGVLLSGIDTNQSGLSANTVYYASNTAGALSSSVGTKEVTIGVAKSTTSISLTPRYNQQITEDEQDAISGGSTFGTPSNTNKFITQDYLSSTSVVRFGGTGADGALNVTSGTTTVDCTNQNICVKNYSSINVSVGATLAFSNPASDGTVVVLKSTGAVTIAGTVDVRGMGATVATSGFGILGTEAVAGQNGGTSAGTAGAAFSTNKKLYLKSATTLLTRTIYLYAGSGGGNGSAGDAPDLAAPGTGGRGGGGVLIESRGALNFTGTINTSGSNGTNGSNGTTNSGGGGGGGGGSAGTIVVLYNSLTANSGTMTSTGGTGGTGGSGSGGDCSSACKSGAGAGSYTAAGGSGDGIAAGGLGAGSAGGFGNPSGVGTAGGTAGATESGLVAQNLYLF